MSEDKKDLYDELLKEALDNLFDADFDKYSTEKNKNDINEYTLLNIPRLDKEELDVTEILSDVNKERKTYDDIIRRRINTEPNSKKRPLTPVRFILATIVLFFVIALGYTLFAENIVINGKASINGALNLNYNCDVITTGELKSDGSGECSIVGNKIKTTSILYEPAENVNYAITITNKGNFSIMLYDILSINNYDESFTNKGDEAYLNDEKFLGAKYVIHYNGSKYLGDKYIKNSNIIIEPSQSILLIINHNWLSLEKQPNLQEDAVISYDVILSFKQHID